MQQGECRSCKAALVWLRMESGSLMPIDAEPTPQGNIVIEGGVGRVLKKDLFEQPAAGERFTSHFATCAFAASHRKKGKK